MNRIFKGGPLAVLIINIVLALSMILYIPKLFTIMLILNILTLFYMLFKSKTYSLSIMLLGVLLTCLWIRMFPYVESIPLGVDPIRDIIYGYYVVQEGRLIYNMPFFVEYYQYFPATQILPVINALISGLDIAYSHHSILSVLLSLGAIPLILITKNISRNNVKPILLSGILYAVVPTIATWGYWIIPMSFSILYSLFSIMFFTKYINNSKREFMILSVIFGALTIMVHAVVGTILLGFYMVKTIYYIYIKKGKIFQENLMKEFMVHDIALAGYTVFYWSTIGFMSYLMKYLNIIYLNVVKSLGELFKFTIKSTHSMIVPAIPKISSTKYSPIIEYLPKQYPVYYIFPRWIWSVLLILIPLLLLLICKVKRIKVNNFTMSLGIYSALMLLFTVISLYFNIIWKADRYIASPATIYAIVFIVASLSSIIANRMVAKIKYLIILLVILLAVTSILDPRVSFYTNPIEGDRVTFKVYEKFPSKFLVSKSTSGSIVSDYNLMTMYLRYLTVRSNRTDLKLAYMPIYAYFKGKSWIKEWTFLLRKYSIESYYIWNINFKRNPTVINKVFYVSNLAYNNGNVFIFKSISQHG